MSDDIALKRFGKYLILDHLVDGGMAKICRGRYLGEGIDKIVAIKMIRPEQSNNESFKAMFMDEVKVSFKLQHPNVVQTYDYGQYKGQFYVAMEYCDGKNLRDYTNKLKEGGFVFPLEISVYIISQASQGLYYAHTLTDKLKGIDLNIIHRDISPHNIILTYDGAVKIIDFGIAKTDSNSEVTQAGTIKGKMSYLAPEYLEGEELDHRYDQFCLGATLWEILCSRKLFDAPTEIAILKEIQKCEVPIPSSINPKVPKELDEIVLKSLSKDRKKRFQDLNEMNKALTKFLYKYKQDFNASDVSLFAKNLFQKQIKEDREKFFVYGKIDIGPYLHQLKKEESSGKTKSFSQKQVFFELEEREATKSNLSLENVNNQTEARAKKPHMTTSHQKTTTKKRNNLLPVKLVVGLCLAGALFLDKDTLLDGLVAGGEEGQESHKEREGPLGYVTLSNIDRYTQRVFVNGKKQKINFLKQVQVPLDRDFTLRIETPGRAHFVTRMTVKTQENEKTISIAETKRAAYGYLITSTNCAKGVIEFSLFGEKRQEPLPISTPLAFPLTGSGDGRFLASAHEIVFVREDGIKVKKTIDLKRAQDTVDLCQLLR